MSSNKKRGPDPADDPLTAAKEKLARAKAAEIEALAELVALRLSSNVMDCDSVLIGLVWFVCTKLHLTALRVGCGYVRVQTSWCENCGQNFRWHQSC